MELIESQLITENTQLWAKWQPKSSAVSITSRLQKGLPVRIFGPCSLQSQAQINAIIEIVGSKSDGIRANDKKPRTRPVNPKGKQLFHGLGHHEAIPIWKYIASKYPNLALGTETMSDQDIYTLAATGILGFCWSGSRTQEQETLQKLGQASLDTQTLMMIKNPLVPDIQMFLGMMENFILGSGLAMPFIAILRGDYPFTLSDKQAWRNRPNFELIPILKRSFPDLPIIIDPSHMVKATKDKEEIIKRRETVIELVQRSTDLGANGFMCEVNHPDHPSVTDQGEDACDFMNSLIKKGLV